MSARGIGNVTKVNQTSQRISSVPVTVTDNMAWLVRRNDLKLLTEMPRGRFQYMDGYVGLSRRATHEAGPAGK